MIDTATRAENTILIPANNAFLFSILIFEREEVFSDVPLWLRQRPAFLVVLVSFTLASLAFLATSAIF